MILETVSVGAMEVNCYVLAAQEGGPAIIIDPGDSQRKIKKVLEAHKLKPALVINTHGHYDHIGCDDEFGVPVYIHEQDAAFLKDAKLNLSAFFALPFKSKSEIRILREGDNVELDGIQLKVIHIPGHTPGGIALHMLKPEDNILFTGDSLFCHSIGRTDLEGGSEILLMQSIKDKLLVLPLDTRVYPGHGPSSSIGEEKKNNPFFA